MSFYEFLKLFIDYALHQGVDLFAGAKEMPTWYLYATAGLFESHALPELSLHGLRPVLLFPLQVLRPEEAPHPLGNSDFFAFVMGGRIDFIVTDYYLAWKRLVVGIHHQMIGSGEKRPLLASSSAKAQACPKRSLPGLPSVEIALAEVLTDGITHGYAHLHRQLVQVKLFEVFQVVPDHLFNVWCGHIERKL